MAWRDPIGIQLLTRNGRDWAPRYPLTVEAVNQLKARSCLIDGEAVACDDNSVWEFQTLKHSSSQPLGPAVVKPVQADPWAPGADWVR